ncbi:hypothetical protein SCMU_29220 [Sinomonas cyclohexanicum]|uniref:Uncharacterized protein n=1 Tax=Sinomonas cyclohexanicum TaxID=322009 RepID=A0ABM7PXS5_SINCY|nr:hypothetical protein [Corynebacterium cyclohexanicum]BCT77080.1 hypothetical protein SCMU_29220 [Corynebacterium cyclohexanicum]
MTETRTPNMPSRRAVTKVAAWSAPVIAAAVAAPMAAASNGGGNANRLAWNPPKPYDTGTGTFNKTGDNVLEIQVFSNNKGLEPGQTFTVTASKGATFVSPTTTFPYTYNAPDGSYTIVFSSATVAVITVHVERLKQSYLDVVFPSGTISMPTGSQLTAVADTNGFANSSNMNA